MGAVQIETYNFRLMNIADYSNKTHLKNLLKNFSNLHELAQCGDTVAASIYVDLQEVLCPSRKILTDVQYDRVIKYFVHKYMMKEIAEFEGKDESAVKYSIDRAITKLQEALSDGRLYEKRTS